MNNPDQSTTGTAEEPASEILPGSGPSWLDQDPVLREMWLNNQTPQEISSVLNRSIAAIMTRAARLGLPRRSAPGRKPGQRRQDPQDRNTAVTARSMARVATGDTTLSKAVQTSLRVCLMCLTKFESQGRHNRICSSCRNSSEYESASALPEIHFSGS